MRRETSRTQPFKTCLLRVKKRDLLVQLFSQVCQVILLQATLLLLVQVFSRRFLSCLLLPLLLSALHHLLNGEQRRLDELLHFLCKAGNCWVCFVGQHNLPGKSGGLLSSFLAFHRQGVFRQAAPPCQVACAQALQRGGQEGDGGRQAVATAAVVAAEGVRHLSQSPSHNRQLRHGVRQGVNILAENGKKNIVTGWLSPFLPSMHVYSFGKRNVLRFDLMESWESFCQRKGKVISCRGTKTEKLQEPTVESLVRGIERLRVLEAKWTVQNRVFRRVHKVKDSHRDKTEQHAWSFFTAESAYLVLNSWWDWEPVERLKQEWCIRCSLNIQVHLATGNLHNSEWCIHCSLNIWVHLAIGNLHNSVLKVTLSSTMAALRIT